MAFELIDSNVITPSGHWVFFMVFGPTWSVLQSLLICLAVKKTEFISLIVNYTMAAFNKSTPRLIVDYDRGSALRSEASSSTGQTSIMGIEPFQDYQLTSSTFWQKLENYVPSEYRQSEDSLVTYFDNNPDMIRVLSAKMGLSQPTDSMLTTRQKLKDLAFEYNFIHGAEAHDLLSRAKLTIAHGLEVKDGYFKHVFNSYDSDEDVDDVEDPFKNSIHRLMGDPSIPMERKIKIAKDFYRHVVASNIAMETDYLGYFVDMDLPGEIFIGTSYEGHAYEEAIIKDKKNIVRDLIYQPINIKNLSVQDIDIAINNKSWSVIPILVEALCRTEKADTLIPYLSMFIRAGQYELFDHLAALLTNKHVSSITSQEYLESELKKVRLLDRRDIDPRYLLRSDPTNPIVRAHYLSHDLVKLGPGPFQNERAGPIIDLFTNGPSLLITEFITKILDPSFFTSMPKICKRLVLILISRNDIASLEALTRSVYGISAIKIYHWALRKNNNLVSRYFLSHLADASVEELKIILKKLVIRGNFQDLVIVINMVPHGTDLTDVMKTAIIENDIRAYRYLRRLEYLNPGRFIIKRPDSKFLDPESYLASYPDMKPELKLRAGL